MTNAPSFPSRRAPAPRFSAPPALALLLLAALPLPAQDAPAPPAPPETRPAERRVLLDSRLEFQREEEGAPVLDGPDFRDARAASRSTCGAHCMLLAAPPWHGDPLFFPGISIPLDRKTAEERRAAEDRARRAREAQAAAEEERAAPPAR